MEVVVKKHKQRAVVLRAIGVISALIVLAGGVTFAALQSQNVTVQGSKITSATASLQIGDGQGGFGATMAGFTFANVEPGGAPMPNPGNILQLRNSGTSNLALRLTMNPNMISNPQNANLDKIFIKLSPISGVNGSAMAKEIPITTLLNAYTNGAPVSLDWTVSAGQTAQFSFQVVMSADAVTSTLSGININGIDLIFNGSSVVN